MLFVFRLGHNEYFAKLLDMEVKERFGKIESKEQS